MKKFLKIPIQLSYLFWDIFWEWEYQSFKDNWYFSDYKKQYIKLIKTFKKTVKDNILVSDNYFLEEISQEIEKSILDCKKSKNIDELNIELISFLTKFSFLLLWKKPDNFLFDRRYFSKTKKINSNWKLNNFRNIQYIQNEEQKINLKNYIKLQNNSNKN